MSKSKFISTPIFYANGEPHLGHAYVSVLADCLHRYNKVWGNVEGGGVGENFFVTGMDEHGQKIYEKAKSENISPKNFVDKYAQIFKTLDKNLNVAYDRFIRTTDEDHMLSATKLWNKMKGAGDLYIKEYEGLYCVGCESFKTDKDLNEQGLCPDHLKAPITLKERNWFFRLSKYESKLKEAIENNEIKIIPETRKKEILSFISEGLQDISFSRSKETMSWGLDVPGDETQVMYVWCDALTNYITAAGYAHDEERFKKLWTSADVTHVIGKDILRFHALYWPAMLRSANLKIPQNILVHGLIKSAGVKMSKSLGNGAAPDEILEEYKLVNTQIDIDNNKSNKSILEDYFQSEVFRYFFLKNISPFDDGDYTKERMKELYNADLANGLGNLLSRVMRLSEKYLEIQTDFEQIEILEKYKIAFENYDVSGAMDYIWEIIKEADVYMQTEQPFKIIKENETLGKSQLRFLREQLYLISRLLEPFMPETSKIIKDIIKQNKMPEKSLFPRYE